MGERPYRLRTMGSLELAGPDPEVAARVLRQPKRFAVLAYLAARPAGERVSRDRVLVTFWPEHPTDRARAGLRNALHFLRRALGAETIVGRGALLEVDPSRLRCDAAELLGAPDVEAALQPGRTPGGARTRRTGAQGPDRGEADAASRSLAPAAAGLLDLYGGEFLDGLYVSAAPDFERWVDRVSAALRGRATDLAWQLSAAAEQRGEWITAAGFARRAAALAVDIERASQRLIGLLDRAGDRAAALAEFERIRARLDDVYGVPPSPETAALAAEVRNRRSRLRTEPDAEAANVAAGSVAGPQASVREGSAEGGVGPVYRSLAVLPFEDFDAEAGSFGRGLTDDLLTALATLRDVRVVSRTSVQRFARDRPRSIGEVRDLLGVDLVVEGSVRVAGGRVRVTVQLIDAVRDAHLWAQTYDVLMSDVFDVQSDVALRIARALDVELSPRDHHRLRHPRTQSLDAFQLYLKGRELWARRSLSTVARSARFFEQALEVDPRFTLAWVGLADASLQRATAAPRAAVEGTRKARMAIERALALDPNSGEANATLGILRLFFDWDLQAADRHFRRAVESSPGHATAHQWYGQWLVAVGDVGRGLDELEIALGLDLLSPAVNEGKGIALYHGGRIEEAIAQYERTWELDSSYARAPIGLALCHAALGDEKRAAECLSSAWGLGAGGGPEVEAGVVAERLGESPRAALECMAELVHDRAPQVPVLRLIEVLLHALLGDHEAVLVRLQAARSEGSLGFMINYAPCLDPLSRDARFTALMDETGLRLPRWR